MTDPELKNHLERIEGELSSIRKSSAVTWRTMFWRGCVYGVGYIAGALVIILIVGWILNVVGVIPAFSRQVAEFRAALENVGATMK